MRRLLRALILAIESAKEEVMAAIDNLEAAVVQNTAAVDKASAKIDDLASGGSDPTRVQAAADQVASDAARLDAKAS